VEKALSEIIASLPQQLKAIGQNALEGCLIANRGVHDNPGAVAGFCYLLNVFRGVAKEADVELRGLLGGQWRGKPGLYFAWARSLGHHG
jgi:hypothetical protein